MCTSGFCTAMLVLIHHLHAGGHMYKLRCLGSSVRFIETLEAMTKDSCKIKKREKLLQIIKITGFHTRNKSKDENKSTPFILHITISFSVDHIWCEYFYFWGKVQNNLISKKDLFQICDNSSSCCYLIMTPDRRGFI